MKTNLQNKENKTKMNAKIKFTRFVLALVLALGAIGVLAPAALAAQPTKFDLSYSFTNTLTGVCDFTIEQAGVVNGFEIDYFDKSGALTRFFNQVTEQDTFTANGKTLVGMPYTINLEFLLDSNGNWTNAFGSGIYEKILLPDGSLFISAGRADFIADGVAFLLSPDKGNPGNVAGFCAALAP